MRRQSSTSRKQTPGARKSILVVGGHPVVREGLTRIINNAPDLVVCERTNAGARVPDAVSSLNPDAAVVHLSIDASVGLETNPGSESRASPVAGNSVRAARSRGTGEGGDRDGCFQLYYRERCNRAGSTRTRRRLIRVAAISHTVSGERGRSIQQDVSEQFLIKIQRYFDR